MVKKLDLRPSLPRLIGGLQRQSTQGIARPTSRLVVQEPHEAPAGESVIPSRDVVQELTDAHDRLDGMDGVIADTVGRYLITSEESPLTATEPEGGWPSGAIWQQVDDVEGATVVIGRWVRDTVEGEPTWVPMADGGAVLHAKTVAAAVGVFIDGMMENLTVTGAANISEAALGTLTARIASVLILEAEQVVVGRDARFWDGGLEFYAPPAEGQDPTDWANRIPIISLMPSGDVSISVAQDGDTTAGLAEDGTVWGRRGTFDTLEVAGQDVPTLVATRAGGIIGAAQLDGNLSVFTTRRAVLGLRVRMEAGRMYRVDWHAGITLGTGTMRMQLDFTDPNVTYYRTQPTVQSTGSVTGAFLVIPTWASGGRDVIVTMTGAVDSGETIFRTGSWITMEDKGPAVPIETATTANPVAGTQLHTRHITSEVGISVSADGAGYWPDSQYMGRPELLSPSGRWREHVRYDIDLSELTGATILSAQLSYTVREVKSSGVVAFTMYAGGALLTNQQLIASQVKGRGGHTYDILPERLDRLVGKTGIVFSPTYPDNASNRYARLGETVTLTVQYRK